MTDAEFGRLCNTYGFAPSRALREMLDKAMEQERESCAKVCEAESELRKDAAHKTHGNGSPAYGRQMSGVNAASNCAAAIRARSNP